MRALVVEAPGLVALRDVEAPTPREDEVLVAPLVSGVCGTDLELIDGTIDPAYVRYPLTLGHEWIGELVGDVPGVASAGDRVVVEGIVPCGVCVECQRGDTNRCLTYDEIGFTRAGALAERIAVPQGLVHRLESSVSLEDALLIEPMAVVWRALMRVPLAAGMTVCVVGDGTIALLAAHMVRLLEPSSVVVVGRRRAQETLAGLAGADEFVTATPERRFDLVIEAAGTGPAVSTALSLAARGATVTLLGLPSHGVVVEFAPDDLVNNDQLIQGSFSYTRAAWAQVVARVNAQQLHPSFVITHRFGLSDYADAIATLRGHVSDDLPRGKVTVALDSPALNS